MRNFILGIMAFCFGFAHILEVDSIVDPGNWTNPESIFVSDNHYAMTAGNNDILILGIADPVDTSQTLDSVIVSLEQYVNDSTRAYWYVRPIINGNPGTATPDQAGSENESVISFNISADITGWQDLFALEIELHATKSGGPSPDWFADYLYVHVHTSGILEGGQNVIDNSRLSLPTITRNSLEFTFILSKSSHITIEIYDAIGRRVFTEAIAGIAGANEITLNEVGSFPGGVYYLTVLSDDGQSVDAGKFVVVD